MKKKILLKILCCFLIIAILMGAGLIAVGVTKDFDGYSALFGSAPDAFEYPFSGSYYGPTQLSNHHIHKGGVRNVPGF
jgi:hypothetical protein